MRYSRQEDLLRLALMMQGTAEGLSLDEMAEQFDVSRRTAERMRDAILRVWPQVEELADEGGRKHWRFPPGSLGRLTEPSLEELAAAHRAIALARREGDEVTANSLKGLVAKLRAGLRSNSRRQIEVDLEAQLLGEGVAFRPGPRERIDPEIFTRLREAILAGVMIEVDHRARASGKLSRGARIGPIALLLGDGRQYLLAWSVWQEDLRLFALAGFDRIELLSEPYIRPDGFDLQEWLAGGFGIWREDPWDVEWCFSPEVADEAATYVFHPKQQSTRMPDGSLLVRFRAGGRQEMEWYLARWEGRVEVRFFKDNGHAEARIVTLSDDGSLQPNE